MRLRGTDATGVITATSIADPSPEFETFKNVFKIRKTFKSVFKIKKTFGKCFQD